MSLRARLKQLRLSLTIGWWALCHKPGQTLWLCAMTWQSYGEAYAVHNARRRAAGEAGEWTG